MSVITGLDISRFDEPNVNLKITDPEKFEKALEWVIETFKRFTYTEPQDPDLVRIHLLQYEVTTKDRKLGLTTLPKGTELHHHMTAVKFAQVFYQIITDDTIKYRPNATPEEKANDKIAYILEVDKVFKCQLGRFIRPWRDKGLI